MENKPSGGGFWAFLAGLTVLFAAMKLMSFVAWSWVWVLCPLWLPPALVLAVALGTLIVVLVKGGVE